MRSGARRTLSAMSNNFFSLVLSAKSQKITDCSEEVSSAEELSLIVQIFRVSAAVTTRSGCASS
jgi:hypothetical protein